MVKLPASTVRWYSLLVLAGLGLVVAGVALISPPAALILGGLIAAGLGFAALGVSR